MSCLVQLKSALFNFFCVFDHYKHSKVFSETRYQPKHHHHHHYNVTNTTTQKKKKNPKTWLTINLNTASVTTFTTLINSAWFNYQQEKGPHAEIRDDVTVDDFPNEPMHAFSKVLKAQQTKFRSSREALIGKCILWLALRVIFSARRPNI